MDCLSIFISISRLIKSKNAKGNKAYSTATKRLKSIEKQQIEKRIW